MSGIEKFQIFHKPPTFLDGSARDQADITELPSCGASSTPTHMHCESTQHETEESTQCDSQNAIAGKKFKTAMMDAWGLLRCKGENQDEFEFTHREKDFKKDNYTIGRSSKCDVTVADIWVSTVHCSIYCDYTQPKMRIFIEDSSVNGTYINNSLVRLRKNERVELRSGDEIFLLNPRKPENSKKTYASFVFINLRERLMAFREISVAPSRAPARLLTHSSAEPPAAVRGGQRTTGSTSGTEAQSVPQRFAQHIEEKYIIGDQIGSGMSGQVYLCVNKATREQCAVKIIDTRKFSLNPGLSVADLQEEAVLMQQFDHPNIIRVVDTFQTASMLYIVMELLRGGDLFDRIIEKERYTEESARLLMVEVLSAVQYLHCRQIVHRDLKPENILLVSSRSDVQVKVTDFGLAKKATRDGLKTFCGTPQYFAPEVLQRKNKSSKEGPGGDSYGKAVDMWSLGVILYILLSGTFPFNDDSEILRARFSLSGIEWTGVSPGAKHLIASLMKLRVEDRLTVQDALRHPWICGVSYVPAPLSLSTAAPVSAAAAALPPPHGHGDEAAAGAVAAQPSKNARKKRQSSTVAVSTAETSGNPTQQPIARQSSVKKSANLRRGASLFAPLELKFKSSQEFVSHQEQAALTHSAVPVPAATAAVPVKEIVDAAAALHLDLGTAAAPAASVGADKSASTSCTTTAVVSAPSSSSSTPRAGRPPLYVEVALAACTDGGHPCSTPEHYIDLVRNSCTSCIELPSPHSSIVHLSVTNETSCLHSRRSTPTAQQHAATAATSSNLHSVPPPFVLQRATSFAQSTAYLLSGTGAGKSAPKGAGCTAPTAALGVAGGSSDSLSLEEDAIEDYSSEEERGKASAVPPTTTGGRRRHAPLVKGTGGCLKKLTAAGARKAATGGTGTTAGHSRGNSSDLAAAAEVDMQERRRKRSVSFFDELCSVVGEEEGAEEECGVWSVVPRQGAAAAEAPRGTVHQQLLPTSSPPTGIDSTPAQKEAAPASAGAVVAASNMNSGSNDTTTATDSANNSITTAESHGTATVDINQARSRQALKRTQSSLEQAWKLAPAPSSAQAAAAKENSRNDCLEPSQQGATSAAVIVAAGEDGAAAPLSKKVRLPMKSITELFRASTSK